MKTILLNPSSWDLTSDVAGNIAVAGDPYSMAQDASSAIKVVQGEQWYDTTIGVPYQRILARIPNVPLMKALMSSTALAVLPAGAKVNMFISSIAGRLATGQVQVTPPGSTTATAAAF